MKLTLAPIVSWLRCYSAQAFLLSSLWSCGSSQLPLTSAEQALLAQVSTRLQADVALQYDRTAVATKQPNGALIIAVSQTVSRPTDRVLCQLDSAAVRATAARLAAALLPTRRFRAYHNKVVVLFSAATEMRDGSSSGVCSRILVARIQPTGLHFQEQPRLPEEE
jgi:hypothetical protein